MGLFNEDYWRKSRLKEALHISHNDVAKLFCNNNDIICNRMRNKIRATKIEGARRFSRLTKDAFLHSMFNDEDVLIDDWDVQLKVGGDFEKGWNFCLTERMMTYPKTKSEKNEPMPSLEAIIGLLKCNTPNAAIVFWENDICYITKLIGETLETKKAYQVKSTLATKWREDITDMEWQEIIEKPVMPKKPKYQFERKEIRVDGFQYGQPEEYVDGKTYYEYEEDSFVRKNWRHIYYENIHYEEKLSSYKRDLVLHTQIMKGLVDA